MHCRYRYFNDIVIIGVPTELLLLKLHKLREQRAELLRRNTLRADQLHTLDAISDKTTRRARKRRGHLLVVLLEPRLDILDELQRLSTVEEAIVRRAVVLARQRHCHRTYS